MAKPSFRRGYEDDLLRVEICRRRHGGILVLIRGATPYDVTIATFLLDTFALGVKDVYLRPLGGRELSGHLEQIPFTTPMGTVEPAYARKLLHDLTAWSHRGCFRNGMALGSSDDLFKIVR